MNKRNLIRLMCPLLVFCSCGDTDSPGQDSAYIGEPVPLSVSSVATVEGKATTRGAVNTGSIGLFLTGVDDGAGKFTDCNNYQYTTSDGNAWTVANVNQTVTLFRLKAKVWAYHPYHRDTENGLSYTNRNSFTLKSQSYTEHEDICYGIGKTASNETSLTATNAVDGVNFIDMKHAYAQVSFKFKLSNYPKNATISKIKLVNVIASTALNLETGGYGATNSTTTAFAEETVNIELQSNGTEYPSAPTENMLMIPCTFQNIGTVIGVENCGLKVVLTVDGKETTVGLPTNKLSALVAGTKYVITITINYVPGISIGASEVSTADWTNQAIDGGVPT